MSKFQIKPDFSLDSYQEKGKIVELRKINEQEIWNDFLNGSDGALSYLYRTYTNKLYNYGNQIIQDENVVSDAIQDLFFELIKNRKKISTTTSVKNYLYASLRRKLVRIKQKQAKHIRDDQSNAGEGGFLIAFLKDDATPFDQFTKEQIELLENACNQLPERQREAILLLFFEEMSYEEVADILSIDKIRSARALIYRAIDNLKSVLGPHKDEFIPVILPLIMCSEIVLN